MNTLAPAIEKPVLGRKPTAAANVFPAAMLQRKCACGGTATSANAECQQCKKKKLQRRAADFSGMETAPPIVDEVLESPGHPLDAAIRSFMEPRFGHDFGKVRVHTDQKAAESARAVNALAYTVGSNVVFAGGQYAPGKPSGRRLLAHELTHVVQQRGMRNAAPQTKLEVGPANDSLEQEADRFAEKVVGVSDTASAPPPDPNSAGTQKRLQRAVEEPAATETATEPPAAQPIVDDETQQLGPGQMRKTDFLDALKSHVCSVADSVLVSVGRTAQGCPMIERWIGHLRQRNVQYIERGIRKYASRGPQASAQDYITAVGEKVREGVARWAATGDVSGVPPELMSEMMGGGVLGALAGLVSGIGSAVSGVFSGIGKLFTKARPGGSRPGNPVAIQARLNSGSSSRPLESGVRTRMETAFGHSFSGVRVHADGGAAQLSSGLNARAFTIGSDVAFAAGEYKPGTLIGDALIAHELAHVIQQRDDADSSGSMTSDLAEYNRLEEDADLSAVDALLSLWSGTNATLKEMGRNAVPRLRSGLRLQRCSGACDKGDRESMTKINLCCTDDILKKEIKPTLLKATGQVDSALTKLKASPKSVETALKDNFTVFPDDQESVARIVNTLDLMSQEMKGNRETFVCRDAKDAQCEADKPGFRKFAETIPGVGGKDIYIKLCANYEMAAFYHGDFLVAGHWVRTFVHEYAHAASLASAGGKNISIAPKNTEFYKEGGDRYPQEKEKNLGNADCYAWFVNDVSSGPATSATAALPSSKYSSMTPWQIAQLPDSEFAQTPSDPKAGQNVTDFKRTRDLALAAFKQYGINFDIDTDTTKAVGREPRPEEMKVLTEQLKNVLNLPGVQKAIESPGARGAPTSAGPTKLSLADKVRIAQTTGEFGLKRYQLEMAISSGISSSSKLLMETLYKYWTKYSLAPGQPTDQEMHIAAFLFFAEYPGVPGFYHPLEDRFYLSSSANLKKAEDVSTARHETLHFLGGRQKTVEAFKKRYGTDYIRHWCIFEEGTGDMLAREAAPAKAALVKPPTGSGSTPKSEGTTVTVIPPYEEEVNFMKDLIAKVGKNGRELVLQAYFTGEIPEEIFKILDTAPTTVCGSSAKG
jgi:hypothetical protein